nr:hypothetical protein [Tanacetum cinerariifolium]
MSRDVITVGSTMRIPLLYTGEYSQWRERFMNYLEEQTDGEAMTNSIQNGDQPLSVIAQVSLARTAQNAPPTLKDPKIWTAEGKKTRKIDRLARSFLIQGLLNDIYSLIDSNESAKDLWDALERQLRGSEYGEQDMKAAILYEHETFKATEGEQFLDTYLRYLQVINDLKKYGYKKDNCDVNDALGYKKKVFVVTSDSLALVAEKKKVSKRKEKVVVSSDYEGSGADDFSELKKITSLLTKAFNRRKFYSKPTNNNLRTSSTSQSANKKQEFVKSDDKKEGHFAKDCKKVKVKDYNYYKTKMLLAKKDSDEQVLLAEDQAWMESSNSDESSSTAEETIAENADLLAQTEVLQDQLKIKDVVIDTHTECQAQYAKLKEERYEYMIRYSALCDNDKQHRKKIDEQEILFDKISRQLVEMNNNVLRLQEKILEKETKISELEGCVNNKDVEIKKCLERLNECFENPSYFEKEKDLRPTLYDEKVIGLGKSKLEKNKSLKSKGFESSENAISESENQSEKECDTVVNSKVIAPGMFKLSVSQSVSPISMSKTSCDSKNVKNKTKRKRLKRNSSKQNDKQVNNDVLRANSDFVHFTDLDTFSSTRRPKQSSVIRKNKGSSNTSNVDLSSVSHSKLNKDVKRYSYKDLLSCNNSHFGETSSAYVCNDAMNVSCNSRLCDSFDENKLFIFDDESLRISPVSKMPFRKKPRDSMNVRSKSNLNKSLPRTLHRWLPKMQQLAEPVAKWIPKVKYFPDLTLDHRFGMFRACDSDCWLWRCGYWIITYLALDNFVTRPRSFESSEKVSSDSENQSEMIVLLLKKSVTKRRIQRLDTFSSVRRPKQRSVIWKKKGSSNTSNVDLSSVSHLKLNNDVKRYSHKDLLSCNTSHLGETSSTYVCNDAMNVSCNP